MSIVNFMLGWVEHEKGYGVFIMLMLVFIRLIKTLKRPAIVGNFTFVSLVNFLCDFS